MSEQSFRVSGPSITWDAVDNEVLIINLDNGSYYSLIRVAADIWQWIDAGCSQAAIIEAVCHRYRADREEVAGGVARFLAILEEEGIIVSGLVEKPAGPLPPAAAETDPPEGLQPRYTPPVLEKYTDMQELLLVDPIHEVEESWPERKSDAT